MTRTHRAAAGVLSVLIALPSAFGGDSLGMARPINHRFSGDLSLNEAVAIALRQNPQILRQIQEIERTRGQIIEVRAQALPHLTLQSSYDQRDPNLIERGGGGVGDNSGGSGSQVPLVVVPVGDNVTPAVTRQVTEEFSKVLEDFQKTGGGSRPIQNKSWEVSLQADQVIYSGGQVGAAIRIARIAEDSAYYQLRDVIDQTIADVRTQFTSILTNRALIKVAEETIRLQEDQLKDQRNRFEAGTVPRFNVLRAEVELANVQPDLIRSRNRYLIGEINLAKTLGLDPGPQGRPSFNVVGEVQVIERRLSLQGALEVARARRPFLKVQRQQILQQTEQIKVALAGYKPTINGRAGYQFRNSQISDDLEDQVHGWFFGFTGQWNIFDGLATYGQVKQARAALESAKINYDDSVQRVDLEVQQAYSNLQAARETIRSQQKNVEQALEALRLANERFAAGAGTQLEILDARTALTRARSTELVARGDYETALAEFDRATATDTVYTEAFRDPLEKLEQKVLHTTPRHSAAPSKAPPAKAVPVKVKAEKSDSLKK